jgi:hypothetical protein
VNWLEWKDVKQRELREFRRSIYMHRNLRGVLRCHSLEEYIKALQSGLSVVPRVGGRATYFVEVHYSPWDQYREHLILIYGFQLPVDIIQHVWHQLLIVSR